MNAHILQTYCQFIASMLASYFSCFYGHNSRKKKQAHKVNMENQLQLEVNDVG